MKKAPGVILLAMILSLAIVACSGDQSEATVQLPVKGMVTMLDLGAHKCIPCRMMEPIIQEVREQYKGRVAVIFVDVWKDQAPARRFKIRLIPTQIFFDKTGKEVYRHEGFMNKASMVAMLKKMGVQPK